MTSTSQPEASDTQSFADFGVQQEIVDALSDAGITTPFPIQALALPVALQRHDIIGQAKTGTGKTLGFGIPLLQAITGKGEEGWDELERNSRAGLPQALVIVPTRELASQVAGDLTTAAARRPIRIVQIYGGRAYEPQVEALKKGIEVVVGTPGRLMDLLKQRILDLSRVRTVVLDEADEMLDLGFLPDVETILSKTPPTRHTMLFSATMPGAVVAMARRYMSQPTHIRAQDPTDQAQTVKAIRQLAYRAHSLDKIEMLARILQAKGRGLTIVFVRTKRTAAKVVDELTERGFAAGALHGDLGQGAREQALRAFRTGKVDVLIATDVAARGIDVDDVTHVINYQSPEDEKTYLHRIGRTGRAGNSGTAVTFVDWDDMPRWSLVDKALGLGIPDPPETYSTSEHLLTELDIPETATGVLPRGQRIRAGLAAEKIEDLGETGKRSRQPADQTSGSRQGGNKSRQGASKARQGARSSGTVKPSHSSSERGEKQHTSPPAKEQESTRRRRPRRRTRGGKPVEQRHSEVSQGNAASRSEE